MQPELLVQPSKILERFGSKMRQICRQPASELGVRYIPCHAPIYEQAMKTGAIAAVADCQWDKLSQNCCDIAFILWYDHSSNDPSNLMIRGVVGVVIFGWEHCLRSYSYLMNAGGSTNGRYVELTESRFLELLRGLLQAVNVDEDWYRAMHPDVDTAIRAGGLPSARYHFVVAGYFEDRLPCPVAVDADWYLAQYPDVAQAIKEGAFRSANEHFHLHGFREGRLPRAGWSLLPLPAALSI